MVFRHLKPFLIAIMIIISIMASSSSLDATRILKQDNWYDKYEHLMNSRLPRGPVPPSGPSLCHNALGLYRQSEFASTQDQSYCP
ncbi:hypothetical protein Hanom_Chr17g01563151 [Helianthus anomalus]